MKKIQKVNKKELLSEMKIIGLKLDVVNQQFFDIKKKIKIIISNAKKIEKEEKVTALRKRLGLE